MKEAYKLLHDGSIALAQVEANGIKIDVDYLNVAIKKTSKQISDLADKLLHDKICKVWKKRYGKRTNLASREQLAMVLFDEIGYECPSRTAVTQRPSADEESLRSTGLKFVGDYLRLEKLKRAKSTYLEGILRETMDGFLHPNFPLNLVQSYRGSSDHPNFQNIPIRNPEIAKLIRQAFIARPNHQLIEVDFKGAEICSATCYHKDPVMIGYIENPKLDLHRDMACEIYMLKKKQVSKNARYCSKNQFVFPQFYADWYLNCAINLWNSISELDLKTPNGTSLQKHLKQKGITRLGTCNPKKDPKKGTFEKHLQEIEYDFWNRRFRVYNQWKKDWWTDYLKNGHFKMLTGFVVEGFYNRKQVINYPIQGTAFHWLLWSLIQIQKLMNKHKMRSFLVGQIHDSILADVHKKEVEDYLKIVKQVVQEDIRKHWDWIIVPLIVEAEIAPVGKSWYEKEEIEV